MASGPIVATPSYLTSQVFYPNDILIIVQAHDTKSFASAQKLAAPYPWAVPLLVPGATENNPLFENRLFMLYNELVKPLIGPHIKYVGQFAYKANTKVRIEGLDIAIKNRTYQFFDAVFLRIGKSSMNNDHHPHLTAIWDAVIAPVINTKSVEVEYITHFNYWFAKVNVYEQYVKCMKDRIAPAILKHPLAFKDARYKNEYHNRESLQKQCGVPHFPHVPFVLERVPYPYFKHKNYRIGALSC